MSDLSGMGRILIVIGLVIAGIGLVMVFAGKIPLLGNSPAISSSGGRTSPSIFP